MQKDQRSGVDKRGPIIGHYRRIHSQRRGPQVGSVSAEGKWFHHRVKLQLSFSMPGFTFSNITLKYFEHLITTQGLSVADLFIF